MPVEFKPHLKFELRERGRKRPLKKGLLPASNRRIFAGTSSDNNIVVAAPKVPSKSLIVEPSGKEKFYFCFTDQMQGLVVRDGVVIALGDLIAKQLAQKNDGYYRVELDVNDEAKLQWGTQELWFKLTMPFPKELKRKVEWSFEMPFLFAAIISLIFHSLLIYYFNTRDVDEGIAMRVEDFHLTKLIAPEQMKVAEELLPPSEEADVKEVKKVEGEGEGTGKRKGKGGGPGTGEGPAQKGILAVLTTHGKKGGVVADVLSRGFDEDLASALGSVAGVQVATSGVAGTRGGGDGGDGSGLGTVDIGDLGKAFDSAKGGGLEEVKVHKVKSDVTTSGPDVLGKLDRNAIVSKVKTYIGGIRSCYENELRLNPLLQGKVNIRFTIGVDGRVSAVEIINSTLGSPEAENCITRRIRRWEFPAPEEGEVVVTYPFVFTVVTQ